MKGIVSFHPIDVSFFDEIVASLVEGRKFDPEPFVHRAIRQRRTSWVARRFVVALEQLAAGAEAPKADPAATPWKRLRANLERMDFRPDETARRAGAVLDPDLHVVGRPFLVMENSAERVATAVEEYLDAASNAAAETAVRRQIARADAELASAVEPAEIEEPSPDPGYRAQMLRLMTKIHELSRAAREARNWSDEGAGPRPAREAVADGLPVRALTLHAEAFPYWRARDVDGLETICLAAGVPPPECLSPAWRLFPAACETFPLLKDALGVELRKPVDVGAFVGPSEINDLLQFLGDHGTRIIGAATRAGEGPAATTLLRKIKECATYAARRGFGYLEACGLEPVSG